MEEEKVLTLKSLEKRVKEDFAKFMKEIERLNREIKVLKKARR